MDEQDWTDYVGWAEFSYHVAMHLLTKGSSLVVAYEVDALQFINLALEEAHSILKFNQDGVDLAKKHEHVLVMINLMVEKARKCYV